MNHHDDDRAARSQVTLRLDREFLDRIDDLARGEGVDRTELVRRLLVDGLAGHRLRHALDDYAAGRRSAWSAADLAGVELYELLDRIAEAGIPYAIDPDALERLRTSGDIPPDDHARGGARLPTPLPDEDRIDRLRARYRPSRVRVLLVGESSPAGGTHFYLADSNLYRATREALGQGLSVASPPEGEAFLAWFRDLGCWLVDLADHPVNREPEARRVSAAEAGVGALSGILRDTRPERVIVVLRRIAPAVRRAARDAGLDDGAIDVLPFPTRQWRPVYVDQLAGIVAQALGRTPGRSEAPPGRAPAAGHAVAEDRAGYGAPTLHEVVADVLRRNGNPWLKASAIAREIAAGDLWRRPGDGGHPSGSQVSARARRYPDLFQTSDVGIRLRGG